MNRFSIHQLFCWYAVLFNASSYDDVFIHTFQMIEKEAFGKEPLPKLLIAQAVPAAVGMLVMSIYGIIDTIFVGRWVSTEAIGAIAVVQPIVYLIASVGMALGIGGAALISRAFGADDDEKANLTFMNQVLLNIGAGAFFMVVCFIFNEQIILAFGGRGALLEPSRVYYNIVLLGVPCLTWAIMSNNIIRSIGHPKSAMLVLLIPAIINLILDPILIIGFDMGIHGAAWATSISYMASAAFTVYFFLFRQKELKLNFKHLKINWSITKEIMSIGSVTLARQGVISLLSVLLNNTLFVFGGAVAVSAYGIISRMIMFANFPTVGITQGFIPILGYNYGAKLIDRVKELIKLSIQWATAIAILTFVLIMALTPYIVRLFTEDEELIQMTIPALRYVFAATPLIAVNFIGSAYFQATGKTIPALLLTLTKQGFFLIPIIFILPRIIGLVGVWMAFPIADVGAAVATYWYLNKKVLSKPKKDLEIDKNLVGHT